MARRNRVSVPDGTYHVTSRIVNREMWLGDPKLKDEIVSWIYGVAAFSGVELLAWAVLDNHFHLVVHVPVPPRELWCDPGEQPDTHAFGMRPPENRPPLWRPASVDGDGPASERPGTPAGGDSPLLVRTIRRPRGRGQSPARPPDDGVHAVRRADAGTTSPSLR